MNKTLPFFDYEKCFEYYTEKILNIRQAKIQGETIVAKPVFLLTLFDAIEGSIFINNRFVLNEWLEERYDKMMKHYVKNTQFYKTTGIEHPFWHLETDGIWHVLYGGKRLEKGITPSKVWYNNNLHFAYFDEPLWVLLENKEWRMKLRNFIVENKLNQNNYEIQDSR